MRILKKRRISTEIETIMLIFFRDKAYTMILNLSTNKSTMPRRKILMNTFISTRGRLR